MLFNILFDITNSRNFKSSKYKCPIQKKNIDQIKDFLVKAETYIRSITHTIPGGMETVL